jgi:hypothetical protein
VNIPLPLAIRWEQLQTYTAQHGKSWPHTINSLILIGWRLGRFSKFPQRVSDRACIPLFSETNEKRIFPIDLLL